MDARLLGRDAVLAELLDLLRGGRALVTATGPPGVGKTAVALAVMGELGPALEESGTRVGRCDLTDVSDMPALLACIARALELPLAGKDLVAALSEIPTLLLLDNFEQLADVSRRAVRAWLEAAPELQLLVTSRERLGLSFERVVEIEPLALPTNDANPETSPAVQLFLQRASELEPRLRFDDLEGVALLVRDLDGLPLAIELAAGRADVLGPRALLARLDERLTLLRRKPEGARRTADLSHSLELSWDLLDEAERTMFAEASVFRGGFMAEALEQVVDLASIAQAPLPLEVMQSLRHKSLLSLYWDDVSRRRLSMLLTLRRYATEQLRNLGREAQAERRHARYFARWADAQHALLGGAHAPRALRDLDGDYDNLSVAVDRCIDTGDAEAAELALRILRPLVVLANLSDRRGAVRARLERACALASFDDVEPAIRADALVSLSSLLFFAGRFDESIERASAAESLTQLPLEGARARWRIAAALNRLGRTSDAQAAVQAGLAIARVLEDRVVEGVLYEELAEAHRQRGEAVEARRSIERSIDLLRASGNVVELVSPLMTYPIVLVEAGELELASRTTLDAIRLLEELAVARSERRVVLETVLGRIAHASGRLQEAKQHYEAAARMGAAIGASFGVYAQAYAALVDDALGSPHDACIRLTAVVAQLHERDPYRVFMSAALGAIEARLGRLEEGEAIVEGALSAAQDGPLYRAAEAARGVLDVVRARRAHEQGDETAAAAFEAAALERLRGETRTSVFELKLMTGMLQRSIDEPSASVRVEPLEVDAQGRWFERSGTLVRCEQRPVMRRMLLALVRARLDDPGRALTRAELLAAGWPDERILPRAARRRLEVMVSRMRELGLQGALETVHGGYRLAPDVELTTRDTPRD